MSAVNLKIQLKQDIDTLKHKMKLLFNHFDINQKKKILDKLKLDITSCKFMKNMKPNYVMHKRCSKIESYLRNFNIINNGIIDCDELLVLYDYDESCLADISQDIQMYKKIISNVELEMMLSDKYDDYNSILSINVGSGGIDSQDFARILLRMYRKYAEKRKYYIKIINVQYGDELGIKHATLLISGNYSYGYLKSEIGVHRLVRISPFDSNSRRHTSFVSIYVLPEVSDKIHIDILSKDIRIDTFRSSGAGGQHVNKTDSAVRITHLSSGVVTICQSERSQSKNKSTAIKLLKSKLYQIEEHKQLLKKNKIEALKVEASFGSQIRNYILTPYRLVKDLRSLYKVSDVESVFNGNIQEFMNAYLHYFYRKKHL